MGTSVVEIASLGLTKRQKAALLQLDHLWSCDDGAPDKLVRLGVRLGFVERVGGGCYGFTSLGSAVIARLKQSPIEAKADD